MSYKISRYLVNIKIDKTCKIKNKDGALIIKYLGAMMKYSKTPDLRSYWTIIYKWITKQIGD